mgnify:CR=1 FL=1
MMLKTLRPISCRTGSRTLSTAFLACALVLFAGESYAQSSSGARTPQAPSYEVNVPQVDATETEPLATEKPTAKVPTAKPLFSDERETSFELTEGYRGGDDGDDGDAQDGDTQDGDGATDGSGRSGGGLTRPPTAITSRDPITFVDINENASALALGPEGRVFVIDTSGALFIWSNRRRDFRAFGDGQFARVVAGPDDTLWGINTLGRVFFFNGSRWFQVPRVTASDIAVNRNGDVVITRQGERVERFNPDTNQFEVERGFRGVQVALLSDGTPFVISDTNRVQRCEVQICQNVGRSAQAISIGPDDSIFIVGTDNRLFRSLDEGQTFEFIRTLGRDVDRVAVGPFGAPWVVTVDNEVLSSRFFDRDESRDDRTRLSAGGDTVGSGATAVVTSTQQSTGIVFSRTLRFDNFKSSNNRFANIEGLVIGHDDRVYLAGRTAGFVQGFDVFDERRRQFVPLGFDPFPQDVRHFDVEADGTFWGVSDGATATVYRSRNRGQRVQSFSLPVGGGVFVNGMAVDASGTVYVVANRTLYVKEASRRSFRQFSNEEFNLVAIGLAGNLWVTRFNGNEVLRFDGRRFVAPARRQQLASALGVGLDGTVFASSVGSNFNLVRFNATNRSFDRVTNVTAPAFVDVDSKGRPWIVEGAQTIRRARD